MCVVKAIKRTSIILKLVGLNPIANIQKQTCDKILLTYMFVLTLCYTCGLAISELFNKNYSNNRFVVSLIEYLTIGLFYANLINSLVYTKKYNKLINKLLELDQNLKAMGVQIAYKNNTIILVTILVIILYYTVSDFTLQNYFSLDPQLLSWILLFVPLLINLVQLINCVITMTVFYQRHQTFSNLILEPTLYSKYINLFHDYVTTSQNMLTCFRLPILLTVSIHFTKLINEMYIEFKVTNISLDHYIIWNKVCFNVVVILICVLPFYFTEREVRIQNFGIINKSSVFN